LVALLYAPVAVRAIMLGGERIQHLAIGICLAWGFSFLWRVLSLMWITSGKPSWLLVSEAVAFLQAGVFLGACYHLTSPGALPNRISRTAAVTGIVSASTALAVALAYFEPDTSWFVNAMRPYLTSQ
jgi:hypothetical protein